MSTNNLLIETIKNQALIYTQLVLQKICEDYDLDYDNIINNYIGNMLEDQKAQINIDNKKTHCTFVINQITNVNCSRPCYNNTNFCKTHFIKNQILQEQQSD